MYSVQTLDAQIYFVDAVSCSDMEVITTLTASVEHRRLDAKEENQFRKRFMWQFASSQHGFQLDKDE